MATEDNRPQTEGNASHFGFTKIDDGNKQGRVDAVFSNVASRYDVMNDLMSGGLHRVWKDAMITSIAAPKNRSHSLIDVAGGTGDIALRYLASAGKEAKVTVFDINAEMLKAGSERPEAKRRAKQMTFVEGNAEELPFDDKSFDAYTIAFGIRNVPDIPKALKEARRVLKTGGRFLCLEFSKVDVPMLDKVYDLYSFNAIPMMGQMVARDRDSYQYLVESIRMFPDQETFAGMIKDAGFQRVTYRNFSGGIAALHSGWRL